MGNGEGTTGGVGGRGGGGEVGIVDCGSWSVPVPLERYEGEIYLGVRPEHVSLVAPDQGVGAAEVRGVEPLGPDTLVRVDAGGPALVARVHGIPDLRLGDRVGVKLDRRQLRSEEHTSELQSQSNLECRLLLEKKKNEQT